MGNDSTKHIVDESDIPKMKTYLFSNHPEGKKIDKKMFMEDELIKLPKKDSGSFSNARTQTQQDKHGLSRLKRLRKVTAA